MSDLRRIIIPFFERGVIADRSFIDVSRWAYCYFMLLHGVQWIIYIVLWSMIDKTILHGNESDQEGWIGLITIVVLIDYIRSMWITEHACGNVHNSKAHKLKS